MNRILEQTHGSNKAAWQPFRKTYHKTKAQRKDRAREKDERRSLMQHTLFLFFVYILFVMLFHYLLLVLRYYNQSVHKQNLWELKRLYFVNKFAQWMYWRNYFIITDCWGEKVMSQFDPRGFVSVRQNQTLCVIDSGARVSEITVLSCWHH